MSLYDRIDEIVAWRVYTASAQEAIDYLKANLTTADIAKHMEELAEEFIKHKNVKDSIWTECIKDFLAYAKTPPKPKRKFPFERLTPVLFRDGTTSKWIPATFKQFLDGFCIDFDNAQWRIVAPFDKDYINKTKPHPDQITAEDLKDYDLSEWEDK